MKYFLFIIFIPFLSAQLPNVTLHLGPLYPQQISLSEPALLAYDHLQLIPEFTMKSNPSLCCSPYNLHVFKASKDQQNILPLRIQNNEDHALHLYEIFVTNYFPYQNIDLSYNQSFTFLKPTQYKEINIQHICANHTNNHNYWSIISIELYFHNHQKLYIDYQFICDPYYHPRRLDLSDFILVVFCSIAVLLLSQFGKVFSKPIHYLPTSFQDDHAFQGFFLSIYHSLVYLLIIALMLFLSIHFKESVERVEIIMIVGLSALLAFFFFNELLAYFLKLKYKIWKIRIMDLISLFLTSILIFIYFHYQKPWFVSNMISFCVLGALIKLFKFRSIKQVILFLVPCLIVETILSIYLGYTIRQEWGSVFLKYFNTPFSVQTFQWYQIYKQKCDWVNVMNICFPGFFVSLCHRFDYSKNTYVYQIVSYLTFLIGMILWVLSQYFFRWHVPMGPFTLIPMILVVGILSNYRYDFNQLWNGDFYDEQILDPFKTYLDDMDSVTSINLYRKKEGDQENNQQSMQRKQMQSQVSVTQNGLELSPDLFKI